MLTSRLARSCDISASHQDFSSCLSLCGWASSMPETECGTHAGAGASAGWHWENALGEVSCTVSWVQRASVEAKRSLQSFIGRALTCLFALLCFLTRQGKPVAALVLIAASPLTLVGGPPTRACPSQAAEAGSWSSGSRVTSASLIGQWEGACAPRGLAAVVRALLALARARQAGQHTKSAANGRVLVLLEGQWRWRKHRWCEVGGAC